MIAGEMGQTETARRDRLCASSFSIAVVGHLARPDAKASYLNHL